MPIKRRRFFIPFAIGACLLVLCSFASGILGSIVGNTLIRNGGVLPISTSSVTQPLQITDVQSANIKVSSDSAPSVVSVIISEDLSTIRNYYYDPFSNDFVQPGAGTGTTQKTQVGAGSGFIISATGLILTNRHVVSDTAASYTVVLSDGTSLDATVLARDTVLDIAILKVTTTKTLIPLSLGDSDSIKIGENVIAIGNSLGEFSNTVSSGIISGLNRTIQASDPSNNSAEQLNNLIQTDASINSGNSGGPLLDMNGKVIGVNVALAENAQSIGFAIPINPVKQIINSVNQYGEIRRPYLGVRYQMITPDIKTANNLTVDNGALIVVGSTAALPAVVINGPADKAGLKVGDVITEINGQKLQLPNNTLQNEIQKYNIGDQVTIKYIRAGTETTVTATLQQQPAQ